MSHQKIEPREILIFNRQSIKVMDGVLFNNAPTEASATFNPKIGHEIEIYDETKSDPVAIVTIPSGCPLDLTNSVWKSIMFHLKRGETNVNQCKPREAS